jgi:hypothetical protein
VLRLLAKDPSGAGGAAVMTPLTYYTVIIGKRSCMVTYAQPPAYETKLFSGSFADPGEASQQFKKTMQGKLEYLSQGVFDRKVSALASRYQQDLVKLQIWNQGPRTLSKERNPRMPLTNEQYFNHLTASGLELAEDYLEQDLATLQENDLPVSDTVAGLLLAQALQEEEQEMQQP